MKVAEEDIKWNWIEVGISDGAKKEVIDDQGKREVERP